MDTLNYFRNQQERQDAIADRMATQDFNNHMNKFNKLNGGYSTHVAYLPDNLIARYTYGNPRDLGYNKLYELSKKAGVLNLGLSMYDSDYGDTYEYNVGGPIGASNLDFTYTDGRDTKAYGLGLSGKLDDWNSILNASRDTEGNYNINAFFNRQI